MAIVKRGDRFDRSLSRLRDEVSELFDRFFADWDLAWPLSGERYWWPAVDVVETDDEVIVKAELPGMKSEDIEISVLNNTLTLSGEKKESQEEKGKGYYHVERRYGKFRRDIPLPTSVDADRVEAKFKDGVLTVTLPKTEQAKPKRIEVKTE